MPNWISNKVKAPSHVIAALLDAKGNVDFNQVIAFDGEFPWDFISGRAETLAEAVTQAPLSSHPLVRALEINSRQAADLKDLSDEDFEQFTQMLKNFRKCGWLHNMDFARKAWGTKWNACDPLVDIQAGTASFDTAWNCPRPVLEALSKKFPEDSIEVVYADEDIGSNCGKFTLKSGDYTEETIAPPWSEMSSEQKKQWTAFACEVKGLDPSEYGSDEDDQ